MADETRSASFDPTKRAFTLFDEFKNFAFKGNVIDLAVGVIIGGAFQNIVNSLVKNVIMPLIALISPNQASYADWGKAQGVPFGIFIADVLNFLLVALVLFLFIVKFLGWIMRAKKQEAAAPPPPSKQEVLLTEIRDLLKQRPA